MQSIMMSWITSLIRMESSNKNYHNCLVMFPTRSVNKTDNTKGAVRFYCRAAPFVFYKESFTDQNKEQSGDCSLFLPYIYIRRENNGLGNDLRLKMISFRYIPQRISDRTEWKRNRRGSSRGR